jgi:hypothetical protein
MAKENQSHERLAERELLEHELDTALAKYAAVEPRVGLEERVLAYLRAERGRTPKRTWWSWSVASAAVAVVVIVMMALLWRTNLRHRPVLAWRPATKAPSVDQPGARLASNSEGNGSHASTPGPAARRALHPAHRAEGAVAAPKLDQFPSPQPLSEQERILASYVEKYPERSALLARARTEALRQDQLEEMRAIPSGGGATDSDDRNNETTQR